MSRFVFRPRLEPLEVRITPDGTLVQIEPVFFDTLCHETDNIKFRFREVNSPVEQMTLRAHPIGVSPVDTTDNAPDFTNCDFPPGTGEPATSQEIFTGTDTRIRVVSEPNFFRPSMQVLDRSTGNVHPNVDVLIIAKRIGNDFFDVAVASADGAIRLAALIPGGAQFSDSAIIGPTRTLTEPSGEVRAFADVDMLTIDPLALSLDWQYRDGGRANGVVTTELGRYTQMALELAYDRANGIAWYLGMNVGNIDMSTGDLIPGRGANDPSADVTTVTYQNASGTRLTRAVEELQGIGNDFQLYKDVRTDHNPAAGNLAFHFGTTRPRARTPIVLEVEDATPAGPTLPRSRASGHGSDNLTRHINHNESVSIPFTVPTSGQHVVNIRYSMDNPNTVQVTLRVNGSVIGSFNADQTGTNGQGWNIFTRSPIFPVNLEAGTHSLEISVSETGSPQFGIEMDTIAITTFEVDTVAPERPTITGFTEDTGISSTDGVTARSDLLVRGTAEPNSMITLRSSRDGIVGRAAVNAGGNWSVHVQLTEGTHQLTAIASDAVGNTSPGSLPVPVTVDLTRPTPTLTLLSDEPSSSGTFTFRIEFDEPVFDLALAGFTIQGGVVRSFEQLGPSRFVLDVLPTGGLLVVVGLVEGAARDLAGNPSLRSSSVSVSVTGVNTISEFIVVGEGEGGRISFRNPDGTERFQQVVFPGFTGGVRTAIRNIDDNGVPDIIVGTGPGTSTLVRVLRGLDPAVELFSIAPFERDFLGGVYVASGDFNGDGVADVIISPDEGGGPRVRIISGADGTTVLADFFGIEDMNFRGGARVAVADVNGDGIPDLIVAAGFGGGPRVAIFDGSRLSEPIPQGGLPPKLVADFFVFEESVRNGVFVAAGDVNKDGLADLITSGGPGGGPRVLITDAARLLAGDTTGAIRNPIANFFAGDPENRGGIRISAKNLNGDASADLLTGSGEGDGSQIRAYDGESMFTTPGNPNVLFDVDVFPNTTAGVFVG